MLDVRLPIGGLFFILGIMIAAWGYSHGTVGAIATKMGPLPINWDIIWGIFMTIFGVAMVSLAKLDEALTMEKQLQEEKARASAPELGTAVAAAPETESAVTAVQEASASADSEGQEQAEKTAGTIDGSDPEAHKTTS